MLRITTGDSLRQAGREQTGAMMAAPFAVTGSTFEPGPPISSFPRGSMARELTSSKRRNTMSPLMGVF